MKGLKRALLASCLGLLAVPAMAWEWNYGPPTTLEDGYRRVHPVPSCGSSFPKPGYIAIGTQDIGGPNPDVYVVYTDVTGDSTFGWEATYDVEGLGLIDDGTAIVSVPDRGYVFLSNSLNGVWRPALTFIDCKGNVVWSQIYPDTLAGQNLWGNDLILTQSGSLAAGTAPGDLAVAGWWWNGANEDAFLMRTDAAGNLIWNIAHNNGGLNEAFNALTEALPLAAGQAGDLVAVGRLTTTAGDLQGLVARVNGNSGAVGPLPQCMQHHGQAGSGEIYNSVTRLQVNFPGQFAIVGTTRAAAWIEDIWVTRGNSCALTAQARVGNPVAPAPTQEQGNDIIEVLVPKPGTPLGSLAIAGGHTPVGGIPKAALTLLNPIFAPLAGRSWLYGATSPNMETFYSLAEDPNPWSIPPGYIFAGLTRGTTSSADPLDMFLVHDDNPAIADICEKSWSPVRVPTTWPQANLMPSRRFPARHIPVHTPHWYEITGKNTCP